MAPRILFFYVALTSHNFLVLPLIATSICPSPIMHSPTLIHIREMRRKAFITHDDEGGDKERTLSCMLNCHILEILMHFRSRIYHGTCNFPRDIIHETPTSSLSKRVKTSTYNFHDGSRRAVKGTGGAWGCPNRLLNMYKAGPE